MAFASAPDTSGSCKLFNLFCPDKFNSSQGVGSPMGLPSLNFCTFPQYAVVYSNFAAWKAASTLAQVCPSHTKASWSKIT